jgi:hypothetical protein
MKTRMEEGNMKSGKFIRLIYFIHEEMRKMNTTESKLGMEAGFAWAVNAAATVVYGDLGMSESMVEGIVNAHEKGRVVELRSIPGWKKVI